MAIDSIELATAPPFLLLLLLLQLLLPLRMLLLLLLSLPLPLPLPLPLLLLPLMLLLLLLLLLVLPRTALCTLIGHSSSTSRKDRLSCSETVPFFQMPNAPPSLSS